ncbi:glycogen/starch/alpha-glucan phosphorylase [Thiomicrospira sp. R3]|uniref:glycogen/starch/alpha-glucan phosphorylase n=1 Tax=Thiomicrospira sp. R3 TaxID=3035472 RepID=UPI00259B4EA7|nr:glycogen/starch/alpha-glucan phosphorylase [Thiomicrospira sp. R3]WFE68410.1 glycogen/starch/alpha-glucan phosphorylase [Thiomicrospira sp. R3]
MNNEHTDLKTSLLHYLQNQLDRRFTTKQDYNRAVAMAIRDHLMPAWRETLHRHHHQTQRHAYYLSMEFLIGRSLINNVQNLGIENEVTQAFNELGLSLEEIQQAEMDAGLGNGGLGRLAACFMDSCASLDLPVTGYGLRYEYGLFRQLIRNGHQIETPDCWLDFNSYPWEINRKEYTCKVKFGGHSWAQKDPDTGRLIITWQPDEEVLAVPFDVPIVGYRNGTVNTLRLWDANATEAFKLDDFNAGSYFEAVAEKNKAKNITMVLYPNDSNENGKSLRLRQQYFLVSASLQDVLIHWVKKHGQDFTQFAQSNVFQLNDTHPSLAVAELMRLLIDRYQLDWQQAWLIVSQTMAYTNHTLLPEALEAWPQSLMRQLLPRPLEIIEEINRHFLVKVSYKWPGDLDKQRELSIIDDNGTIRMAHLAIVGSFSVNGVAALHSELLKNKIFNSFYQLWPHKFNNKTNGVTPRRWIAAVNPELRNLINETLGTHWLSDLNELKHLETYQNDASFLAHWRRIKQNNKQRLADYLTKETGIELDIQAMFDVQVKRIHEYKRQLLNVLHLIHLYIQIKNGHTENWTNRVVIFGGKAAPGYWMAKLTIKLINNLAEIINKDQDVGDKLKVVFYPDYRVSAMEMICPATDLSEQISTAGKEASGTGNMKFMMNGALTIGTLDGANVEILEAVGQDNFFLFGLEAPQIQALAGHYQPQMLINQDRDLKAVMQLLEVGHFNLFEPGLFNPLLDSLKDPSDPWKTLADFRSYIDAQALAAKTYLDQEKWSKMSLLNCARSSCFSADRTIKEYNKDIWKLS